MIPYKVDALFEHRPVVNWLVSGVLVLVFVIQVVTSEKQVSKSPIDAIESPIDALEAPIGKEKVTKKQVEQEPAVTGPMGWLVLDGLGVAGLFGHNWLHANVFLLIANLLFLWALGNAVCSKIGNKAYLAMYLGLCFSGGIIHMLLSTEPALGASVAVSGIVGMYLVFFPENSISCFFVLPRPVTFSILGYWVILLWFVVDVLASMAGVQRVCYCAHIVGFGAGSGLAVLTLKKKWVVMERGERSLLQMLGREKKEEEGEKEGEEGESKDLEAIEKGPETPAVEKAVAEKATPKIEKPKDEFIRFRCQCGHKIKVHRKNAGKTGRCPKCSAWVEAPRE